MRSIHLIVPATLFLAACGMSGTAQVVGDDPNDTTGAIVENVVVRDTGCDPATIALEEDRKTLIHFVNEGGPHTVVSDDFNLDLTLQEGESRDVMVPTRRDGSFDLRCGIPGQDAVQGEITVD